MSLSSQLFLFYFLPLVLVATAVVPRRGRNLLLVVASYLFYAWANPLWVPLILATTTVDYLCGLVISRQLGRRNGHEVSQLDPGGFRSPAQKTALWASLATDLLLLGFFKYSGFALENVNALLGAIGLSGLALAPALKLALPLGISFYTFKSMTYTISVYRGHARGTRSFVDYACFVAAFPQLVAGPIWRWADAAPQLVARTISAERAARGVMLFSFGLAKKVLLADSCAAVADAAFGAGSIGALDAWFGALAFTLQIYFDFSGYSDMAIGVGHMLGFEFPINFNAPYRSDSITEFWRRWHISLSTWFRDYVFLPVAYAMGRRLDRFDLPARKEDMASYATGAMVTMLLCGLWHGAAWTFVVWGGILGLLMVVERLVAKARWYRAIPARLKVTVTFVLIVLAWVVFRASSLPDAGRYLTSMAGLAQATPAAGLLGGLLYSPLTLLTLTAAVAFAFVGTTSQELTLTLRPRTVVAAVALLVLSLAMMFQQAYRPFLYSVF
jgi:alginate O-acetyltransferase complex protein AlgI